ncbi:MAG: serine/threonine protein kinase [Archangium sp.]|nr:serine/threonine protein kinase [Archangium sp.]
MAQQPPPIPLQKDPLVGTRVGEYEVLEPIGEGGMGVVYRGIQPVIKKRVAIKVLKPEVAGDGHQVQRLVAEAESVNAIGHRGIIDIFGLGALPDGRPYIIMEYLDGEALDLWLQKQPGARVPLLTALELLLEICAPLSAAHRANVIHRDLKPSNIFVCRQADGTRFLKLLDFGLAKRAVSLDGNTKQTNQTTVSGTPDYMAPEQARGLSISPRSDVYALGVLAYELFTGHVPFQGATPMDVMVAHVNVAPKPPREVEPSLPPELDTLTLRMLAKAPEQRPQSVDEVRGLLEDAVVALGNPRPRGSGTHAAFVPGGSPASSSPRLPPMFQQMAPAPEVVRPPPLSDVTTHTPSEQSVVRRDRRQIGRGVGAVVALGLVLVGGIWFLTRPPPEVTNTNPPVNVVTPRVNPPVVAPVVAPVAEVAEVDAGAAEVEDAGVPVVDAGVDDDPEPVRPKNAPPPPTVKQLKERIGKLEARAKKKKNLDPTALQFLGRYRIDAAAADTPAKRTKVERALNEWERNFLRK